MKNLSKSIKKKNQPTKTSTDTPQMKTEPVNVETIAYSHLIIREMEI